MNRCLIVSLNLSYPTLTLSVPRPRILPGDLLATIQPHLSAELVKQIGATFVFDVQGDDGGIYYIDLKNGMFGQDLKGTWCSEK